MNKQNYFQSYNNPDFDTSLNKSVTSEIFELTDPASLISPDDFLPIVQLFFPDFLFFQNDKKS